MPGAPAGAAPQLMRVSLGSTQLHLFPSDGVNLHRSNAVTVARPVVVLKCVAITVAVPALFWAAPDIPHNAIGVLWLGSVGLSVALSHYCLERAREHLDENWVRSHTGARFLGRWSWFADDYDEEGRPWLLRCRVCAVCALVLWFGGSILLT